MGELIARDSESYDSVLMGTLMRSADADEALAMGFCSPVDAVMASVDASAESFSVLDTEGLLVAMFGLIIKEDMPGFGMPWLCATDELSRHKVTLFKATREIVGQWNSYVSLYNWIHERNGESIRFITAIGFEVDPVARIMPEFDQGEMFNLFWMGDKPCVS